MSTCRRMALPVLAASLLATAYNGANAVEPGAPARLIDKEFVTLIAVRKELDAPETESLSLSQEVIKYLKSYYDTNEARLVRIDGNGLSEAARDGLRIAFERTDRFGLNRHDYSLPNAESGNSAEALVATELRHSLAALTYADHAQSGRFDPRTLSEKYIDVKPQKPDPAEVLGKLAAARGEIAQQLGSFHPPHEQFKALQKKLMKCVMQRRPERLAHVFPMVLPSDRTLFIRISPSSANVVLEAAVRAFQEEKGLRPDSIVGSNTRQALNVGTIPVSVETISRIWSAGAGFPGILANAMCS